MWPQTVFSVCLLVLRVKVECALLCGVERINLKKYFFRMTPTAKLVTETFKQRRGKYTFR